MTTEQKRPDSSAPQYMLTNTGHKRLTELQRNQSRPGPEEELMSGLCRGGTAGLAGSGPVHRLLERGWIAAAPGTMTAEEARLRYARNPLQHLERFNFEMTTRCNFNCRHCRNGGVEPCTETNLPLLKESAETVMSIGIRRFDFIGGEVSRFGTGWLELTRHICDHDRSLDWRQPLIVTLYTNGWWLDKRDFTAAGWTYADDEAYLRDLQEHGVTHILFSIDGPEATHDEWRGHPGLFRRVFRGLAKVRRAGIQPRLSVVLRPGESTRHLLPFARRIYGRGATVRQMASDTTNLFNNLVDTANGSDLRRGDMKLKDLDPALVRCKAFFRPSPTIRIMASGAIGICPLMQGQEGFGNIHERPLADLLNSLQDTPLYRLHAGGDISRYLKELDPASFGESYDHICSVRRAVMIRALEDEGGKSHESLL